MIRGFGTVTMPEKYPEYEFSDKMLTYLAAAPPHLPALTFISQARRSLVSADHEVAFFLYFRILNGYFADGSSRVELAFVNNQDELKKYLPYHPELIDALSTILTDKKLTSKSRINFKMYSHPRMGAIYFSRTDNVNRANLSRFLRPEQYLP